MDARGHAIVSNATSSDRNMHRRFTVVLQVGITRFVLPVVGSAGPFITLQTLDLAHVVTPPIATVGIMCFAQVTWPSGFGAFLGFHKANRIFFPRGMAVGTCVCVFYT